MTGEWYCALLDNKALRGVKDVRKHVNLSFKSIFGKDLVDVCVPGEQLTDKLFEVESENYVFFCCTEYDKHIQKIYKHPLLMIVLPETKNPVPVPESEIEAFTTTIMDVHRSDVHVGDKVRVREGYLRKLNGVVLKDLGNDVFRVAFYFYTRTVVEDIRKSNLVSIGTVFIEFRQPVILTEGGDLPLDIDKNALRIIKEEGFEDTIHRGHSRKPAKKKRKKT